VKSGPEKLASGPAFFEGRHVKRTTLEERRAMVEEHTYKGLLALLLRDGGHFTEEHGTAQATRVAFEQWQRDQRELEDLRRWRSRDARTVTWGEVRAASDSTWTALDLADKLLELGFEIEDFPGR